MVEKEVRGYIKKEDFPIKLKELEEKFGKVKESRRLTFAFADYDDYKLETKIRLTDKNLEITQKEGHFNALERNEIFIDLKKVSAEIVLNFIKVFSNLLKNVNNPLEIFFYHESYIFINDGFEIKVGRQFGKNEFYFFEVEELNPGSKDIKTICKEYGLIIDEDFNEYKTVLKRNNEVNLLISDYSDEELIEIIKNYI